MYKQDKDNYVNLLLGKSKAHIIKSLESFMINSNQNILLWFNVLRLGAP